MGFLTKPCIRGRIFLEIFGFVISLVIPEQRRNEVKTRDFWLWLFGQAGLMLLCLNAADPADVWTFRIWLLLALCVVFTFVYLAPKEVKRASLYLSSVILLVWVQVYAKQELTPMFDFLLTALYLFFLLFFGEEVKKFSQGDFRERKPVA